MPTIYDYQKFAETAFTAYASNLSVGPIGQQNWGQIPILRITHA